MDFTENPLLMMNGENSREKKKKIEKNSLYSFDDYVNYCLRAHRVDII